MPELAWVVWIILLLFGFLCPPLGGLMVAIFVFLWLLKTFGR